MTDKTYDLRSDTVTQPSPAMKQAMVEAPLGDDVLGDDPTVELLEKTIAELVGKQAGLFFPSGTQANETALNVLTEPGCEVIVEARAHIFNYEAGAPAVLSGVQIHPVDTEAGFFDPEALEALLRPRDEHFAQTRLLCFENTHNGHGGRIYPIDAMEEAAKWARERDLKLHLDGARLFNAAVASGIPVERYAACADTVSLCLSKGLGAPIGTCLVGDGETIVRARWVRKRLGGGMRQVGIIAAAGLYALEHNIERLADDHALARQIAQGLSEVSGLTIDLESVQSNIVLVEVTASDVTAAGMVKVLEQHGVRTLDLGPSLIRLVTHLDVPQDAGIEVPRCFRAGLADLGVNA